MTVSIPHVTFPGTGTSRELTGRLLTSGLILIMSRPAAPAPGYGRQPAPPGWPGDSSGLWLRNAAAGLCLLAAAAAAVSFTAQYRMAETARHLPVVAALEAAIPTPPPWSSPAWASPWRCTAAARSGPGR